MSVILVIWHIFIKIFMLQQYLVLSKVTVIFTYENKVYNKVILLVQ